MGGKPSVARVTGPLGQYAESFRREIEAQGYKRNAVADQLRLMAHVSRWLAVKKLDVADLADEQVADRFLAARRRQGYTLWLSRQALVPLLGHLRALDVMPTPSAVAPMTPVEAALEAYRDYLERERALADGTVVSYVTTARRLFEWWAEDGELRLDRLGAADVIDFVRSQCQDRGLGSAKGVACGTRAVLRYLFIVGEIKRELASVVPAVAGWKLATLPSFLTRKQIDRLLASCDRRTRFGRRDYAVLVLLARMGLRAGEVAGLELSDIDWRAAEIVVRGKGNRQERLPLPVEAGEALAGWLKRGRPPCDCPQVITRVRAPHRRLTSSGISNIVASACTRAGLPVVHAHRLRHSAATEMLRAGAGLPEVGQVLRHRRVLTTAIYTKVDRAALAGLARPWPRRAS
jgi:integrase/recombinase XerD